MMEILLIRHTTPDVEPGTCYGHTNLDVNGTFEKEASEIERAISDFQPDSIFSSPLIRCSKLAKKLFPHHPFQLDDRLMEMSFGRWEKQLWQEIPKDELDIWANDFMHLSPPGGESFKDFIKRINEFETEAINKITSTKTALVTHSGVIRFFLMKHLNIPSDKIFNLHLNYGAVIKIDIHSEEYSQVKILKG
ncbi:MAG: alpha-ribazole phosphatase [Marinilabiliaceae bacterium]|nr:alpha-ribazole phosphatase [Marinilabiliaceae bacterium]